MEGESPFSPGEESEPEIVPEPKHGLQMQEVYREWLKWDNDSIRLNTEGIVLFEQLSRKHLHDKAFYDECQKIIAALKIDNEELKKDVAYVAAKLGTGNKTSGNSVRFRLEEDKRPNRDA